MKENQHRVIAIDGPSGSGKSTLARNLAATLEFLHVDSGSLYRAVTWQANEENIDVADAGALAAMIERMRIEFFVVDGRVGMLVNGSDPGDAIRKQDVTDKVSPVSAVPQVREHVTAWLRNMRALGDLVMEGRDIGTVVFPDASCKFFLVCDNDERAKRRHVQYETLNEGLSVADVGRSLEQRDRIDSGRKTAPLKQAEDAVVLNNTAWESEETLAVALSHLPEELSDGH